MAAVHTEPTTPSAPTIHAPPRPSKFAATAAAEVALGAPPVPLTAIRERNLRSAATLWCRHLQFPTARTLRDDLGMASTATALHGFDRLIDVHAAVIRTEWDLLEHGWFDAAPDVRAGWLTTHAVELAAIDPALLRLPGLVCSAVFGSGAASPCPDAGLVAPLHAIAALADAPGGTLADAVEQVTVRMLPFPVRWPSGDP